MGANDRTAIQKLTATQCTALARLAYALMQARTHIGQLHDLCERLSAHEFITHQNLYPITARFMVERFRDTDAWSRAIASDASSALEQHGLDCGQSSEDAANLWRSLNEQSYRADR